MEVCALIIAFHSRVDSYLHECIALLFVHGGWICIELTLQFLETIVLILRLGDNGVKVGVGLGCKWSDEKKGGI